MTFEFAALAGACGLGLVQIVLASHSASLQRSYRWSAGARDERQRPLIGLAGRLSRALANFGETFPIFVAAVVMAHLQGAHDWRTTWGAGLYLGARIAYLLLYVAGAFLVRSLVWNVAVIGILLVIWAAVAS